MISKNIPGTKLKGRKVRVNEGIENRGGHGIVAGSYATITDVVRGRGIELTSIPCEWCGQYMKVRGVARYKLTLAENADNGSNEDEQL